MAVIACRTIAGQNYIGADVSQKCYTTRYYMYLYLMLIPGILLFLVIIPYILFKPLQKAARPKIDDVNPKNNRKRYEGLLEPGFKFKYGFLYNEYRHEIVIQYIN